MTSPLTESAPAPPTWCALVLAPAAWPATSMVVRGQRAERDGAQLTVWDGERAVHRVPAAWVIAAELYATHKDAERALKRRREANVGGATVHVAELGLARQARGDASRTASRRGASAIPAEGISFRVEEG